MKKIKIRLDCIASPTTLRWWGSLLAMTVVLITPAQAADRNWNAGGDASTWTDKDNWLEAAAPTVSDNAVVDQSNASATVSQDFKVKSITLGKKRSSVLNVNNFVTGGIEPAKTEDDALFAGKKGKIVMKGTAGKITLKGAYKDSEAVLPDEPTFMFYAQ